jgi:hypothetical protein
MAKSSSEGLDNSKMMPVVFIVHGTPMNAIEDNEFPGRWQELGQVIAPARRYSLYFLSLGNNPWQLSAINQAS